MMMKFISSIAIVLFFFSCTEKVSIQPEYTGNTDWTPVITLVENNYHRYELAWRSSPEIPLEVERNISQFLYELKRAVETDFSGIDSLDLTRYMIIPATYRSKPLLEELVGYSARMKVRYRDGTERTSNEVAFIAPEVKGKVLKRIPFPDDPSFYPPFQSLGYFPYAISFDRGFIYSIQRGYLTRIDTASGEAVLLATNLDQIADYNDITDLPVHDNITFLTRVTDKGILNRYNVQTLQVEMSFEISRPEGSSLLRAILYTGTDLYVMWEYWDGGSQVLRLDPANGQALETFPKISRSFYWFYHTFAFDGTNIWITDYLYFDYKIAHFDPATGNMASNQNQIPAFEPRGVAWDGSHFWVYELDTHSYVKVELEGI